MAFPLLGIFLAMVLIWISQTHIFHKLTSSSIVNTACKTPIELTGDVYVLATANGTALITSLPIIQRWYPDLRFTPPPPGLHCEKKASAGNTSPNVDAGVSFGVVRLGAGWISVVLTPVSLFGGNTGLWISELKRFLQHEHSQITTRSKDICVTLTIELVLTNRYKCDLIWTGDNDQGLDRDEAGNGENILGTDSGTQAVVLVVAIATNSAIGYAQEYGSEKYDDRSQEALRATRHYHFLRETRHHPGFGCGFRDI
ncbi:hypothetical protein DFJ77DRAFT_443401, partial [Powellomyces hirtus]